MVDDEDKKKDLDNEYSALSDALDGGDSAPSLEDLLKDHGIDLGSDMDLDAMQDFSFSEPMDMDVAPPRKADKDLDPAFKNDTDLFGENLFDDHLFDEPAESFMPPPRAPRASAPSIDSPIEPLAESMGSMDPMTHDDVEDTSIFETSDFDDVNAGSDVDLGSDPLFDYDPQAEATFADVGGAEPDMGGGEGGDGGMGGMPPPDKNPGAKRIFIRLGMMLVLVSVIYGGLRLFLGDKTPETVAEAPEATTPPSQIAKLTMPENAAPAPTTPAPAAPTQATPETPETPAPAVPETVVADATPSASSLPVPGAVSSGLPDTTPVVTTVESTTTSTETTTTQTPDATTVTTVATETPTDSKAQMMHDAVASPVTSFNVALPTTSVTTVTSTTTEAPAAAPSKITMGSGDVNEKLDNLELALQSIDQRLAQVSAGGVGDEKIQRLERLVNDSSAPEMQDVLQQAVKKMRELDRKLDRISELQQQVRMLNTDVKMLKEDVETQTNMVGEQQRLFNDNVQLSQMAEPGPVKMMVQAAIPGRAWLRSERGELLTVIPGDEVPGYGRVVSIDAASGTVVTSSRAVFREQ